MALLENKVAVITGATSGIGARCAERFIAEGARVVLAGRRREAGLAAARWLGPAARFVCADVADEAQVRGLIDEALAQFGRIDCLINNAGHIAAMTGIEALDADEFDHTLRVHLRGAALGMKYVAAAMRRQGGGSIINMASLGGMRGGWTPHSYSAAKAALIHLTRCVAVELGESGIRVNCISPGPVVTGIFAKGAGLEDTVADHAVDGGNAAAGRPWSQTQGQVQAMAAHFTAGAAVALSS